MTALSCKFVGGCSHWIGVPHVSRTPLQVILVRQVQAALITLTRGMDMRLDRCLPLLKIALVLMRLEHVASFIVDATDGIM
jgi:hypothetical protein